MSAAWKLTPMGGLSPRVRGNLPWLPSRRRYAGSIPARAGEPSSMTPETYPMAVYPRACGGTYSISATGQLSNGLSPRVRGNHLAHLQHVGVPGSIPARAGEPPGPPRCGRWPGVYPRACGGTPAERWKRYRRVGLSPRVRGNRRRQSSHAEPAGSIPARAGEPTWGRRCWTHKTVYPRACGGTLSLSVQWCIRRGLSPRVRGNRCSAFRASRAFGSIPARAGEPKRDFLGVAQLGVYPRACGGTVHARHRQERLHGLSPRVRGNPAQSVVLPLDLGSIPARAGEPSPSGAIRPVGSVYPRACGGTRRVAVIGTSPHGLSPRVRGNRLHCPLRADCLGSIPARAGEPRSRCPR